MTRQREVSSTAEWFQRLALLAIAWGALPIGGVHPWAYLPLAVVSVACGAAGLLISPSSRVRPVRPVVVVAAGLVGAAILVQLVPLPLSVFSAERLHAFQALDPMIAAGVRRVHPISIWPDE